VRDAVRDLPRGRPVQDGGGRDDREGGGVMTFIDSLTEGAALIYYGAVKVVLALAAAVCAAVAP
jgi:hypothetical protein